jgi:hypothetical protein
MTENQDLESLRERRDRLITEREIAALESEIAEEERLRGYREMESRIVEQSQTNSIAESWGQNMAQVYGDDPAYVTPAGSETNRQDDAGDRADGDFPPHFISEESLALIRGESDDQYRLDTATQAVVGAIANYVLGSDGFTYKAVSRDEQEPVEDDTLAQFQEVIDDFLERSRWGEGRQHESFESTSFA